ncbi:SDR family NAD(P)-dependent oxidoreductase [Desulfoprunum benzoelyticum]|uniref:Nucleoside-diphosphate-sugar epimerase n=1 Tax=Desulfoprunum benzoelyticum TaxID=1506996 RepID=A0A840V6N5_9BACT|nr:SDR family NAD(P)-dependent oxidoreductase [Desulfoprunum benzoelyticum]MBB5348691.1 nucleoside-diphosphate-sugar epimerase [Desulfoprunum benzoelyticum]MBM9530031.1 SDR family NAD(P)-dependent oxidoreductase [Desulfoprunum benzoelyticum]
MAPSTYTGPSEISGTIAITGATGFIGRLVAQRLASSGWKVRALVRPASLRKRPDTAGVEWITGDMADADSLERLTAGVDAIIHCAGAVRGATAKDFDDVNVDGVARLATIAAAHSPQPRFLLVSSLAAREPRLSFYAASKHKGEKALASLAGTMFWGVFRPAAVYGPGDREMLPLFQWMFRGVAPVIGSADNRVSLLYVDDLVEAMHTWLQHNSTQPRRCYELHDGRTNGYSWQDIITVAERLRGKAIIRAHIPVWGVRMVAQINLMAARVLGASPMLTPGKVRELVHADWVADNSRLYRDTAWIPRVLLEEGMRQTMFK